MIPKTIHQIWAGPNMPKEYQDWCKRMKMMNPDWEYKLWRDDLIERYKSDPYVSYMRQTNERLAFLVDRLRVLLLRDDGGLYCDVDCYAVRPFRILENVWTDKRIQFVAGMRSPDRRHVSLNTPGVAFIDNTVLASAKNGEMAQRLCNLYQPNAKRHTGFSMGREIMRNADYSTLILGYRYFYAETQNPDMIVSHDNHNLGSWNVRTPTHA